MIIEGGTPPLLPPTINHQSIMTSLRNTLHGFTDFVLVSAILLSVGLISNNYVNDNVVMLSDATIQEVR